MPMHPQVQSIGSQDVKHVLVTQADMKSAPLPATNNSAPAAVYGAGEQAIMVAMRDRINAIEARLVAIGMLSN